LRFHFSKQERILLSVFIFLKLAIHFYFNIASGLHRDEYLYLSFSDHMAWGYVSVPPFIGVVSWIVDLVSGESNFWVRLFPTLAGGLSIFLIGVLVKEMGGKIYALVIACMAFLLSPVMLRVHSLFQPVPFDQLFWLAIIVLLARMVNTQDRKLWYALSILWAIAILNKYLVGVLIISSLIALLPGKERKLLFTREFFLSGLIAFMIILPNLVWQYNHNFPVFHHLQELHQTQLVNVNTLDFMVDQVVMNMPAIIILTSGLFAVLFSKSLIRFRFLGITYIMLLVILIAMHGKNYYTLGIYPVMYALGGAAAEMYFTGRWRFMRTVTAAMVILLSLPFIPITSMPFMKYHRIANYAKVLHLDAVTRWEDGKQHEIPQDFADMTGWDKLYDLVFNAYSGLDKDEKNAAIIYTENYGEAGAIKYYGKNDRIPEPISFSDSFLLWAPDSLETFKVLIYVDDDTSDIRNFFEEATLVGRVNDPYFRENGVPVYLFSSPYPQFYETYQDVVRTRKEIYQRK